MVSGGCELLSPLKDADPRLPLLKSLENTLHVPWRCQNSMPRFEAYYLHATHDYEDDVKSPGRGISSIFF